MRSSYIKILSLVFLLAFANTIIQKSVHDFEHRLDKHCDVNTEKHIHELEHNCNLCDFTTPASITEFKAFVKGVVVSEALLVLNYQSFNLIFSFLSSFSLRGPPVILN
ncbi:MAG: hypothetical protein J0M08_12230 [Bacteroidetes bacterium]|nr:hypothetical protein [Bacteroidota bacterium]